MAARQSLCWILPALLAVLLLASAPVLAERRVALVIGNDAYTHLPDLANARRDAEAVGARLEALGFEVILRTDADRRGVYRAREAFEGALRPGDVALVFYAGHGVQAQGRNWLIPVDARLEGEWALGSDAIETAALQGSMARSGAAVQILILDACRNNPLPAKFRDVAASRGLEIEAAPAGTGGSAVLYAAAPGEVASDGTHGGHGIFTAALLEALQRPARPLEAVFREVNGRVRKLTGDRQKPWLSVSLPRDFYFEQPESMPVAQPRQTPPAAGEDALVWGTIQLSERQDDFVLFLERYPDSPFAPLAKRRLAALAPATPPAPQPPALEVTALERTLVVTASLLNVREMPGGKKTGTLAGGTEVVVTGETTADAARWYRIALAGGAAGWVAAGYLGDKPEAGPATPAVGMYPERPRYEPGDTFRDCQECPEMVVIPPGEFWMGSPESEVGREQREGPRHHVRIGSALAVGKYEVTFAEWDACVAAGGCSHRPKPGVWWRDRSPVIGVTWEDAQGYVAWLSRRTGAKYRLLSESEWEYAARAGTTTPFHTGEGITPDQANFDGGSTYNGSSKGEYRGSIVPVGSFGANRFGLHDMHGNVWEWVEDCWNGGYTGAPADGSAWMSGECGRRVLRGGSWFDVPGFLRSANRSRLVTGDRVGPIGFRVARAL